MVTRKMVFCVLPGYIPYQSPSLTLPSDEAHSSKMAASRRPAITLRNLNKYLAEFDLSGVEMA
jgi:hypothetical protein